MQFPLTLADLADRSIPLEKRFVLPLGIIQSNLALHFGDMRFVLPDHRSSSRREIRNFRFDCFEMVGLVAKLFCALFWFTRYPVSAPFRFSYRTDAGLPLSWPNAAPTAPQLECPITMITLGQTKHRLIHNRIDERTYDAIADAVRPHECCRL